MSTKNKTQQNQFIDRLGDWNPQVFREIKGRFKGKNIAIATVISGLFQIILYLGFESSLPSPESTSYNGKIYSRYCLNLARQNSGHCLLDPSGNLPVNWPLWWLDIFTWMSILGIFALLIAGVYLLVADLSKEESRGTLNFIRMSPQTATNILVGKILGVPILLYWVFLLALPLHLIAGLSAGITLTSIATFYVVVVASCAFFYSMALLLGLINLGGVRGLKPWLGSGVLFLFLWSTTVYIFLNVSRQGYIFDWIVTFNPIEALLHTIKSSSADLNKFSYLELQKKSETFLWYGIAIWQQTWTGIVFLLLNFALWTYWVWQGVKRGFHNPINTVFSKKQSYFIGGIFTLVGLGFSLQNRYSQDIFANFALLQFFLVALFLGIIAAISPQRQILQDWARYRHQNDRKRNLISDLIWGEKSPSTVAIAINILTVISILSIWLLISPTSEYKLSVFTNLILFGNTIVFFAAIAQLILFMKTSKRAIFAWLTIFCAIVVPLVFVAAFQIDPDKSPFIYLFTIFPMIGTESATTTAIFIALLTQWLAIALLSFFMAKKLQKVGESETKAIFSK